MKKIFNTIENLMVDIWEHIYNIDLLKEGEEVDLIEGIMIFLIGAINFGVCTIVCKSYTKFVDLKERAKVWINIHWVGEGYTV